MTQSVAIAAAWDFASYGTATMTVEDGDGTHSNAVTFTSGIYEHKTGICATAGVASIGNFGTALTAQLNAMGTKVYTVTQAVATGKYTISVNSGTLKFIFSGSAGDRMAALIGQGSSITSYINTVASASFTSPYAPWFWISPARPGVAKYTQALRQKGSTLVATATGGTMYRLRPTTRPMLASWEHHYEPKARVDHEYLRDVYSTSTTQLYDWEQLWTDYGLAQLPIGTRFEGVDGRVESFAWAPLVPDYDESVCQRYGVYDDKFTIRIKAQLWPTTTADLAARSFA